MALHYFEFGVVHVVFFCCLNTKKMLQSALQALQSKEQKVGHRLVRERRKLNNLIRKSSEFLAGGDAKFPSKFPSIQGGSHENKWQEALNNAQTELRKINAEMAAVVALKNKEAIVKKCTPCLNSDEHGHKVGISMAEWKEKDCNVCLDKDMYMRQDQDQASNFREYKHKREQWEKAEKQLQVQYADSAGLAKLNDFLAKETKLIERVGYDRMQQWLDDFSSLDKDKSGLLTHEEVVEDYREQCRKNKQQKCMVRGSKQGQESMNRIREKCFDGCIRGYIEWRLSSVGE